MQFGTFVKAVKQQAHLESNDQALHAIHATLMTLGERLVAEEANDLAAQLPHQLQPFILESPVHESFSLEEFYTRVASREAVDIPTAKDHASSVLMVVNDAVSPGEMNDIRAELPREFDELFTKHLSD